jgi:hypothetical protein
MVKVRLLHPSGKSTLEIDVPVECVFYWRDAFGRRGLDSISGLFAQDSVPVLERALINLSSGTTDCNVSVTQDEAETILENLLNIARIAEPLSVWGVY